MKNNPLGMESSPVIRNFLDLLHELIWVIEEKKSINIEKNRSILENNHYDLEKVKEIII